MTTQTLIRTGVLPSVNLLPPEIGAARRLRNLQLGLGVGVAASVAVVAALFVGAAGEVSGAQDDLDATRADTASLQAETAKYADVPAVIAKVDAAKLQRTQAMSQEIHWSLYLNDISLRIPAGVWLTSVTATESSVDGVAAAAAPGSYPVSGIGNVTFEGQAYKHTDVASWLQVLAREGGFIQPYFTNSAEDDVLVGPSGDPAVKFTSQVTVTDEALSRRFEEKAGS